ncbi:hypothetical protein Dimus_013520 [Dionaea muscipula]
MEKFLSSILRTGAILNASAEPRSFGVSFSSHPACLPSGDDALRDRWPSSPRLWVDVFDVETVITVEDKDAGVVRFLVLAGFSLGLLPEILCGLQWVHKFPASKSPPPSGGSLSPPAVGGVHDAEAVFWPWMTTLRAR